MGRLVVRTRQSRIIVSRVQIGFFVTRLQPLYTDASIVADGTRELNFSKPIADSVGVTDLPVVDGGKVFNEAPAVSESAALAFAQALTENLTITEGERRALEKAGITDIARAIDRGTDIDVIKALADVASILESDAKTLFKAFTDGSVASEAHAIAILRYVQDNASAIESAELTIDKIFADFGVASDVIDTIAVDKPFSEAPTVSDVDTLDIGVNPSDSVGAASAFDRTVQFFRDIADGGLAAESHALALAAVQGDSVGVSESIAIVMQFFETFSDVATVAEAEIKFLFKSFIDDASTSDSETLWIRPFKEDGVTIGDIPSIGPEKPFTDAASVTDVIDVRRGLNRADVVAAVDTGSLFNQGYADISYFAEDYVGDARTF